MARFGQTSIGRPEYSVHSASSHTTPAYAPPRVPLLQRRITNPMSDRTPVPGPAPHVRPQRTSTDNPSFCCQVCRLVEVTPVLAPVDLAPVQTVQEVQQELTISTDVQDRDEDEDFEDTEDEPPPPPPRPLVPYCAPRLRACAVP